MALRVTPGFSAECAAVGHGLHEAYARRCVIAFWRLMPTIERYELVRGRASEYVAADTRRLGGTLLRVPTTHGGVESLLDRHLGCQDLYDAFEGERRHELVWADGGWREQVTRRSVSCGWAFALMEMLVDPLLCEWVPKWVVEQYERRNPHFREALASVLRGDRAHALTNRQLLLKTRRLMCRLARAAERAGRAPGGGDGAGDGEASTSGHGSGSDRGSCSRCL